MTDDLKIKTPKGKAMYARIVSPDPKYKKYKITVVCDVGESGLKEAVKKIKLTGKGKMPFKYDKENNTISITMSSRFPADVFDAQGKRMEADTEIGNGSTVRASGLLNKYDEGVNIYFKAVQIIDLIPYEGASAESYGFDKEEGYTAPSDDPSQAFDEAFADDSDGEDDDSLPF